MKRWIKRISITLVIVLLLSFIGFRIYVGNYYHTVNEDILPILEKSNVDTKDNVTSITHPNSTTGFIFYPGGKVESSAYLPLLDQICSNNINCYLVEMPYNLAVFNTNAATSIIEDNPQIYNWYIGGHSLGGAMASKYYAENTNDIKGLILLGSYIYGDVDPNNTLTIYGSNDLVLDKSKITYTENVYVIEGGNHAGFGNYGIQDGDGIQTTQTQQKVTSELVQSFIKGDE